LTWISNIVCCEKIFRVSSSLYLIYSYQSCLPHCLFHFAVEAQLFDKLICKATKTVISLFDQEHVTKSTTDNNRHSKQSNRRRRRKEKRQQQREQEKPDIDIVNLQQEMMKLQPSQHLSAEEWNQKLMAAKETDALLLDVRNVYESRVGHFSTSNVPTLLTNTRKYSDLPGLLVNNPNMQDKGEVFMYCTGGIRCERVSMLVQTMYPKTKVYQLKGGIQSYLRDTKDEENCLFKGKNFVFDPRRTDPVYFGPAVGTCLVCKIPHDDYDNGNAPSESKEARCNKCRMLVLICNECRPKFTCWGEGESSSTEQRTLLYCALEKCVHEGATPEPELLEAN
jgi:predicted sulfurtransferase